MKKGMKSVNFDFPLSNCFLLFHVMTNNRVAFHIKFRVTKTRCFPLFHFNRNTIKRTGTKMVDIIHDIIKRTPSILKRFHFTPSSDPLKRISTLESYSKRDNLKTRAEANRSEGKKSRLSSRRLARRRK